MRARASFRTRTLAVLRLLLTAAAVAAPARAEEAAGEPSSFPLLRDDGRPSGQKGALVLVVEGLDGVIRPEVLRARLSEAFGRPVIALSDAGAESARGTLWLGADQTQVTLRLSTPPRPDLWQRLPRAKLGADPVATLAAALLDMLWSERMKPESEMRDPFCPPGMVCGEASEGTSRRPVEQAVLDPWDPANAHFDRAGHERGRGDPWENEPPARAAPPAQASAAVSTRGTPTNEASQRSWAVAALVGGGVHLAGGFARYELNALRRFPRFDIGLTYVGGRGQPDATEARRAVAALSQYRWIGAGLEINLGGCFGIFVAEGEGSPEVRPYLRALGVFAIATPSPVDVLIQSEVGTTFTSVASTGAFEYALSLGPRYSF
jgi:hypothetical protein